MSTLCHSFTEPTNNRHNRQFSTRTWWVSCRPGPNIPLNFPIIQIIILHLSTPLFKRKLPLKKADKMQMKHEYDKNVHVQFGQ